MNQLKNRPMKGHFGTSTGTQRCEGFDDAVSAADERGVQGQRMAVLEMTEDLLNVLIKNGEYVQTVLMPSWGEDADLLQELQSCVASIAELRPRTINPTKIVQLLGIPLGSPVEQTVLPGGLTEEEYKSLLSSRLLSLVPRLHMRRKTTLELATSLVTRLCDATARGSALLVGSEYAGTATGCNSKSTCCVLRSRPFKRASNGFFLTFLLHYTVEQGNLLGGIRTHVNEEKLCVQPTLRQLNFEAHRES
ncbi:unnamed protein product [Dibothriocephalus latus]|uniref:Uncharacterized protein n=1 Tax=Dibothriocephalus latus TaxID=60516 RepID=A0A3P6SKS0_DIBLA|nr:unnamed protein product [Dibothriocephalus latus]